MLSSSPSAMAKRKIHWRVNDALLNRLEAKARTEDRHQIALIEQALAEYLNVPLANRELPEQPVEVCANCRQGVLHEGRCAECRWRRDPRASHPRSVRARAHQAAKHSKEAKEMT
jgi:hypothetical protein